MPTIFRFHGFRFFFYSNEGAPREPVHVHVIKGTFEAKFWLRPEVRVAYNSGFNAKILRDLVKIIENNRVRIERHGVTSSVNATKLRFDQDSMWVELSDGRILGIPLAWFPQLLHAQPAQRKNYQISARGLHWNDLDEDISINGLLHGFGDQTARHPEAA